MIELSGTFNKLNQLLSLYGKQDGLMDIKQLGTIDIYYLNAIEQLKNPTIGRVSKLLNQSTPNTNYHLKKLIMLGLVVKKADVSDKRVIHLVVTDKYKELTAVDNDFWNQLESKLEEQVTGKDLATFRRVLKETINQIEAME
ncbi:MULTISPECIES: MarR family winged helix-turn-helix transcriptional regulator [Dellaglioa]|uniref:MarR family transcriptional regulator n=3 Tax=Dellaglioa TaxID=2767880 RepID=A0A0R1HPJ4_9LACO|nr:MULTISPECIES: MarR family winged helix-turn-helix transcriptional regulator [Dellaglioa]KRK45572.1 MarR family transcriptional regulator [Dellaglioa algida DSM 15638]MCZ2491521.1 MarR family winged helix-turn-helix transcriptional regulator [Dellaglioa carnosa]MCZ2492078.1 MarR family winged helix-turn-helix transcriptional regulator [Dellaglioa carnosa]MCZ2494598.1 MarR family winged helix-turn-helix transcriptional regulator [Dellaglioa carnosa]MDK1717076.1 MarR family winged helix-turn-h